MSNIQIVQQTIESARTDFESNVEALKLNLNFQKEASFALQIFQSNNYLAGLNPDSIRNAVINVSLTGLTLNPVMKMAYLIPRKGKCVLDISYIGLIKILTDTGSVKNIEAKIVYSNEPFDIQQGTNPFIKHGINTKGDKGDIVGVYSIATLNDGSTSVEWMYYQDIVAVAQRSESVKKGSNSPWNSDFSEMARKTVVKRHYKYLPKSERAILAANAIDIDHDNNGIDFEKENRENTPINIDTIEPTEENKQKFEQMFQGLMQPHVPSDYLGGQSKEDFITDIRNELHSGALSVEKGEKIYNYVLSFFQK